MALDACTAECTLSGDDDFRMRWRRARDMRPVWWAWCPMVVGAQGVPAQGVQVRLRVRHSRCAGQGARGEACVCVCVWLGWVRMGKWSVPPLPPATFANQVNTQPIFPSFLPVMRVCS